VQQWEELWTPTTPPCTVETVTYTWLGTDTTANVDWTTLCDGHPRLPESFTFPTTTGTSSYTNRFCGSPTPVHPDPYTGISPNCTIAPSYCNQLYEVSVLRTSSDPVTPACSTSSGYMAPCGDCTIFANGVQLFYWPVTTVGGSPCNDSGSTITASPTGNGPNTIVLGNSTYISGSAYLSFSDIFATVTNGALCGTPASNIEFPVPTNELSSLSLSAAPPAYTETTWYTESFNIADLNWPVPLSAYRGMCFNTSTCFTMSRSYLPQIELAAWLTGLQPEWLTCSVHSTGVFDPPKALSLVSTIAGPTMEVTAAGASSASSVATPGGSVSATLASVTTESVVSTGTTISQPAQGSATTASDADPSLETTRDPTGSNGSEVGSSTQGSLLIFSNVGSSIQSSENPTASGAGTANSMSSSGSSSYNDPFALAPQESTTAGAGTSDPVFRSRRS
jgi:hypothetical protein